MRKRDIFSGLSCSKLFTAKDNDNKNVGNEGGDDHDVFGTFDKDTIGREQHDDDGGGAETATVLDVVDSENTRQDAVDDIHLFPGHFQPTRS